jgi:hypothetical protein
MAPEDDWTGFEAAHIFTLAYEGYWKAHGYDHWISIPPEPSTAGMANSVQKGLLLRTDVHQLFDSCLLDQPRRRDALYSIKDLKANNCFRTITRPFSSPAIAKVLLESI